MPDIIKGRHVLQQIFIMMAIARDQNISSLFFVLSNIATDNLGNYLSQLLYTGEIDRFTNDTPNRNELHGGTFRLIAMVNNPAIIVGTYLDERSDSFVRAVISKTAFMYNKKIQEDFDKNQAIKQA